MASLPAVFAVCCLAGWFSTAATFTVALQAGGLATSLWSPKRLRVPTWAWRVSLCVEGGETGAPSPHPGCPLRAQQECWAPS